MKVLFFVAHPDDEVLGCGGTIALYNSKGYDTKVIIFTNGENSNLIKNSEKLSKLRQKESIKALNILGTNDVEFLNPPDNTLKKELTNEKLIELYKNYLEDDDTGGTNTYSASSTSIDVYKPSGEVNVSEQKGYITSVEDARETLEKIFKLSKES